MLYLILYKTLIFIFSIKQAMQNTFWLLFLVYVILNDLVLQILVGFLKMRLPAAEK